MHKQSIEWIDHQFENDWRGIVRETLETNENKHDRQDLHSYIQVVVPDEFKGREKWAGLNKCSYPSVTTPVFRVSNSFALALTLVSHQGECMNR